MCRYAFYKYKNTYGCFNCQVGFKRRNILDADPNATEAKDFHCPNCRTLMVNLGRDLRLPRKEEDEEWRCIKYLTDNKYNIYSCGCQGIGFVPHKMEDAIELVASVAENRKKVLYEEEQQAKQLEIAKKRKKNADALRTKLLLRDVKKENREREMEKLLNDLVAHALLKALGANIVFNKAASKEDLDKLEMLIGASLPQDFLEFYQVADGNQIQSARLFNGLRLLTVAEIIEIWQSMKDIADSGAFNIDGVEMMADADIEIKNDWWHQAWLPITDNLNGDYTIIDLSPSTFGIYGQVFSFWHDPSYRTIEARSFKEFIAKTTKDIASQKLIYSSDYNGFINFK
jgi:cell wall assembly regulator SMI1